MSAKSESINELAAALSKAQGQMSPAKMDATNPFLKNKYADLGSVIQAAKAPLASNGLSFTQAPELTTNGTVTTVTVTTLLMHSTGQWIESAITLPLGDSKGLSLAQSVGSIITYLRRYSLSAILGIYADEDQDGNDTKPAATPAPKPAQHAVIDATPTAAVVTPTMGHVAEELYDTHKTTGWPLEVLTYFVTEYKLKATNQAANMLNLSGFPTDTKLDILKAWVILYKKYRADGKLTPQEAAEEANKYMAATMGLVEEE
jgi:hypothetical protein